MFEDGDASDFVAVLLEGRVKLTVTSFNGRELVLGVRGRGALVGQLAAIAGGPAPRPGGATALEPTRAMVIPAADFDQYLGTRPGALYALAQDLGQDLRDAMRQWKQLGSHDTLNRVIDRLLELATEHGQPEPTGIRITACLSQEELAGFIGASREAVVRGLRSLRARGLITTDRRSIVIRDLDALRRQGSPPHCVT